MRTHVFSPTMNKNKAAGQDKICLQVKNIIDLSSRLHNNGLKNDLQSFIQHKHQYLQQSENEDSKKETFRKLFMSVWAVNTELKWT